MASKGFQKASQDFQRVSNGRRRYYSFSWPFNCCTCTHQAFMNKTLEHVAPSKNRSLHVEKVDVAYDWKTYFQPLQFEVAGLTPTHLQPDVNHCWRIVRRCDLPRYTASSECQSSWAVHVGNKAPPPAPPNLPDGVSCTPCARQVRHCVYACNMYKGTCMAMYTYMLRVGVQDFIGLPEHANDAVLLCKQFMSSTSLAQPPELALPVASLGRLSGVHPWPDTRNEIPESQLAEFKKTARLVGGDPWQLHRAQEYLEKLCNMNERKEPYLECPHGWSPHNSFVVRGRVSEEMPHVEADGWHSYAVGTPREILFRPVQPKAVAKKAAAKKPAAKSTRAQAPSLAARRLRSKTTPAQALACPEVPSPVDSDNVCIADLLPGAAQRERSRTPSRCPDYAKGQLGCTKCRFASTGCTQCKKRVLRAQAQAAAKAPTAE